MPRSTTNSASTHPQTRNRSDNERALVVSTLLNQTTTGILRRGAVTTVAESFGVSKPTIRCVWKRAVANYASSGVYTSPSRLRITGQKRADRSHQLELVRTVDPERCGTIRAAAHVCLLPTTSLFRDMRSRKLRTETSGAKPMMSDDNQWCRTAFSLDYISAATHYFNDMENVVHVDDNHSI
ncbi:unnamed protein product [Phytophthora fragariaefolia]|uniref:Unnamed protein product n=1 Tax=Phytophthora fragariaefolia TaxID=1490495 RepID=A0A9W6XRR3_9STRA|nr:unnamed protein product [Phytophthora fragariaefolia]